MSASFLIIFLMTFIQLDLGVSYHTPIGNYSKTKYLMEDNNESICQYNDRYVANRENCNQFYICDSDENGKKIATIGICPSRMWFDPIHSEDNDIICIYPEVACTNDQIDMYTYCNCKKLYPSGVLQVNTDIDKLTEFSMNCLVDNKFHIYASDVNCERYFVCYNGNIKRMQCKPGLHYNSKTEYCDHPTIANCGVINRDCPPTGISFLRHPHKCDAFYYCIYGNKLIQRCGFYKIWDENTMTCVRRSAQNKC